MKHIKCQICHNESKDRLHKKCLRKLKNEYRQIKVQTQRKNTRDRRDSRYYQLNKIFNDEIFVSRLWIRFIKKTQKDFMNRYK